MSAHEDKSLETRPASREDVIEKGAGFIATPPVPADWEPPSASLVMETPPQAPAPSPQTDDGGS